VEKQLTLWPAVGRPPKVTRKKGLRDLRIEIEYLKTQIESAKELLITYGGLFDETAK